MHIIIAIVTALGGLAWALIRLQNSGVDLNSFNPFYWARRRRWAQVHGTRPLHKIENPMDAASVLVVAITQLEGPVTREHKDFVVKLFVEEFNIEYGEALEMYNSSAHLLVDVANICAEVKNILAPTISSFQDRHKNSLMVMLKKSSESEGAASVEQTDLINTVSSELTKSTRTTKQW
jgi:hypothetical protein